MTIRYIGMYLAYLDTYVRQGTSILSVQFDQCLFNYSPSALNRSPRAPVCRGIKKERKKRVALTQ